LSDASDAAAVPLKAGNLTRGMSALAVGSFGSACDQKATVVKESRTNLRSRLFGQSEMCWDINLKSLLVVSCGKYLPP
jgi:hypothetical protein